jgi:hypothetical protein
MNITNKELTPQEFNKLHHNAIKSYTTAVWQLADLLKLGKEKFSRKTLLDMTCLPSTKVDWLISISNLINRDLACLPEVHYELIGSDKAAYWLNRSIEENLKPTQVRQLIRDSKAINKPKTNKINKCSEWSKHLMLAEAELKRSGVDKATINERLKPLVDMYNKNQSCL